MVMDDARPTVTATDEFAAAVATATDGGEEDKSNHMDPVDSIHQTAPS